MDSQNCNRCQGCCYITVNSTALCKCDEHCQEFGDCCGENSPSSSFSTSLFSSLDDRVKFACQSTFTNPNVQAIAENKAFLMISTCPSSWLDPESSAIESNCSTLSQSLPAVTDITTGLVYRNEYCAHCNRVPQLVAWPSRLVCSEVIYDLIMASTLSMAVDNDPEILNRECKSCSFLPPNIMHTRTLAPRSCIPRVETCLPQLKLEAKINKTIEEEDYTLLVMRCHSGPLDLVRSVVSGVVYRNKLCATCNADYSLECFELQERDINIHDEVCDIPERTVAEITDLTTEMPTITTSGTTRMTITRPTRKTVTGFRPPPAITPRQSPEENIAPPESLVSFVITLSYLGDGQISVSSVEETTSISVTCPEGEVLIGTYCRPTQCPEGYSMTGGRCSYADTDSPGSFKDLNFTSVNCSTRIIVFKNESYIDLGNGTIVLKKAGLRVEVLEYDDLGHPVICQQNNTEEMSYLNCTSALVVLNESDYTVIENGSISFEGIVVEVRFRDEYDRPLICPDLITSTFNNTRNGVLAPSPGIQELTYIGCSLSVLGAIAVLLTYSIFSELQTFPGLVLMNLCVAIFANNLVFIIGGPVIQYYPLKEICSTLAILLHYFYLSQFSWMSIFSFETMKNLYQARRLVKYSRQGKYKYLAMYLAMGWILPLLIITITIIVNFTTEGLVLYGVNSQGQIADNCWINHYQSFIIAFVLPLVLSLSCNLVLFVITTFLLCRAYKDQSKVHKSNIFTMIRVWLAIFTITGLTWIFGFFAIFQEVNWMWYLFVIFNSTQGFSIFLTFIFTKKVLNLYKMQIRKRLTAKLFKPE